MELLRALAAVRVDDTILLSLHAAISAMKPIPGKPWMMLKIQRLQVHGEKDDLIATFAEGTFTG